jgi:hypothetical protein
VEILLCGVGLGILWYGVSTWTVDGGRFGRFWRDQNFRVAVAVGVILMLLLPIKLIRGSMRGIKVAPFLT